MKTFYLALGSNLGDREMYLREASRRLGQLSGVLVEASSSIYETEPVGPPQGRYLNQVVRIRTGLLPRDLLTATQRIELDLGRTRELRWGPRTLDVDLLWWDGPAVMEEDLVIPHPRIWERDFVLIPLAELAPSLRDPGGMELGQRMAFASMAGEVRLYRIPGLSLLNGRVRCLDEVVSTMDEAKHWLEADAQGGIVAAESQSGGRGRWGRNWWSAPGSGLWFSLPLFLPAQKVPLAALALAVAVRNVLAGMGLAAVSIKWPNDVLLEGRKVAGILLEGSTSCSGQGHGSVPLVAGIGVNVHHRPVDFPPELADSATSLLASSGRGFFRPGLLASMAREIDTIFLRLAEEDGPVNLLEEYGRYSATLGRRVRFVEGQGTGARQWEGEAIGITPAGELVIKFSTGEERVFASGEVHHLRLAV